MIFCDTAVALHKYYSERIETGTLPELWCESGFKPHVLLWENLGRRKENFSGRESCRSSSNAISFVSCGSNSSKLLSLLLPGISWNEMTPSQHIMRQKYSREYEFFCELDIHSTTVSFVILFFRLLMLSWLMKWRLPIRKKCLNSMKLNYFFIPSIVFPLYIHCTIMMSRDTC